MVTCGPRVCLLLNQRPPLHTDSTTPPPQINESGLISTDLQTVVLHACAFKQLRVPHAKMLTLHLDKIRLERFNSEKNMQHNDTISWLKITVKRWWHRYENVEHRVFNLEERLVKRHMAGSHFCPEVNYCRSNEFVPVATSSLPFKHMNRRASTGHLQISDRGVIFRKKHGLDLTGLRILRIHVTQFSPKWAEPLLLSYTYTIIYSMSNKSTNYTETPLQ